MMSSSDPRRFFESDADQSKRARREAKSSNKLGKPIVLKSKIAAAVPDPHSPSDSIFIAESAGSVRRINVDDETARTVYRGPSVPVTCLAVGGVDNNTLFAGSWDKHIWSWHIATRQPGIKFVGHSDFVKAVISAKISGEHVLISGGADKKIMVWNSATGSRLHVLQDTVTSMLAVQSLAVDPILSSDDELVLVSAGSDPQIRRWKIRLAGWEPLVDAEPGKPPVERRSLLVHETGVYKAMFDHDGDEVDLWTASGDGTAKCLERGRDFTADQVVTHGDHVRALAVTDQLIITAGRDEDLKVWDKSSLDLKHVLEGHYDEVVDLVVLQGGNGHGERLVSVSIDGTVRTWPLDTAGLEAAVQEQEKAKSATDDAKGADKADGDAADLLTAEEEAELAELMDD